MYDIENSIHSHGIALSRASVVISYSALTLDGFDLFGQANPAQDAGVVGLLENSEETLPHLTRFLTGIDAAPDAGFLVVIHHGGGLGVVRGQALLEGIGIVVGTLNQRLSGNVIHHI
jgi:hypothetical protein